jgi:large subunit ribosomal protein L9
MKVILLTDIPKVGNRHDVKDFKEGYAQNVLLSKGLAELATPAALARLSDKKAKIQKIKDEEIKSFTDLINAVDSKSVVLKVKANEKGHLFKAVNALDVAKALKDSLGIDIETSAIGMEHIKELGSHIVTIQKGDMKGKCTIHIEAQ